MYKYLIIIIVFICFSIGCFSLFNAYIYKQKQSDNPKLVAPYSTTLSGKIVCLPHKNTQGPQTLECAYGLQTDADEYYALDFNQISKDNQGIQTGSQFKANGTVTPLVLLSTNQWDKYGISGIFTVKEILQIP